MPDFIMCDNDKCLSKDSCFRFTAIPDMYAQSYFKGIVLIGKDKCEWYWDDTEIREQCYQREED